MSRRAVEVITRGDMERRIAEGIEELLADEAYLFEHRVSERTISQHLAVYFQKQFPSWDVDCDYNLAGDVLKRITLSQRCRGQLRSTGAASPDVIVHRRGSGGPNLLAVEIKKVGRSGRGCDLEKLRGYIAELGYQYGLFISFRVGPTAKPRVKDRLLFPETPPN